MADPVVTDATKTLADTKATISGLVSEGKADLGKVKVFWADYRTYIVLVICFLLGAIAGYKFHS